MDEIAYRQAEERLFADAGIAPEEQWIELATIGTKARVLAVGSGRPVLFLTGGPMAAATWAYVAGAVGVRALLLDRPGTGLSPALPSPLTPDTLPHYVSQLTIDVLDSLGLDSVPLVGSSLGGYSALRTAIDYPARVDRVVLAGIPAFAPGWHEPAFFSLLRTPVLGSLVVRLPASRRTSRMSLVQLGHRRSLEARRIPNAMLEWTWAWQRHTHTMRNDALTIRACGSWRGGFDPSLDLHDHELTQVAAPCLVIAGTDDPVGDELVARNLALRVATGAVESIEGGGHLPWLDDPERFAKIISGFV